MFSKIQKCYTRRYMWLF